jgi:hypothetical protein
MEDPQEESNYNPEMELEDAITQPDLSSIESKDPSLSDGFKIAYNKEVPLDIKLQTSEGEKDFASFEPLKCKVLSDVSGKGKDSKFTQVKVELSWESDLLFHYNSIIDEYTFADMKKKQNLNINFQEFCKLIEKICENCIKMPDTYIGTFTFNKDDGNGKLQFVKQSDFKFLELLLLDFKKSSDEIIQKNMLFRFACLKSQLEYDKKVIKIAGDVIMQCNPDVIQPILETHSNYNLDINKFFGSSVEESNL